MEVKPKENPQSPFGIWGLQQHTQQENGAKHQMPFSRTWHELQEVSQPGRVKAITTMIARAAGAEHERQRFLVLLCLHSR